jgi:hypothetical protein
LTLVRVYRAYYLASGEIRYVVNRDPAAGPVSPTDHRWLYDRDPAVGDTFDLTGHDGRTVTVVARDWHSDVGQRWLQVRAVSVDIHNPDRP